MTDTLCEAPAAPATLTAEERRASQKKLWRRYSRSGHGSKLENSLVEEYLPLVKTVVGRLAMTLPSHVNTDDLYSAGLVGLLNAVRRYNPNNGTCFETYARVRIRGAVFDELRRLDWVPRSIHDKAKKFEKTMQELTQRTGRVPTTGAMAKAMGLSLDEYDELLAEIRPATYVCLDALHGGTDEHDGMVYEVVADDARSNPEARTAFRELTRLIEKRLNQLPEMQRKVLGLYYFEDLRLREIAEAFGVTESRICQIHSQAIIAIKSLLKKEDPEAFQCAR
jgi:RNA polymerase sigma factor for flagellar operon FliA